VVGTLGRSRFVLSSFTFSLFLLVYPLSLQSSIYSLSSVTMSVVLQQGKPWIVQKYGGTSLGKLLPAITGTIIPQYLKDYNVAVVCSALSGTTKSMGTTSLLLQAIDYTMGPLRNQTELNRTIDVIKDQHLEASRVIQSQVDYAGDGNIFEELDAGIRKDCEKLRSFLAAAQVRKTTQLVGICGPLMRVDDRRSLCAIKGSGSSYGREVGMSAGRCIADEQSEWWK
jgi:hypothetical protein